jgi:hypothetical protein
MNLIFNKYKIMSYVIDWEICYTIDESRNIMKKSVKDSWKKLLQELVKNRNIKKENTYV